MYCTEKGVAWKLHPLLFSCADAAFCHGLMFIKERGHCIPFFSIAQAQLSVMDSCSLRKGAALSPSVLLRRRSFLSLNHVLYRKGGSFIPFCSIAQAQLSAIELMFCTGNGAALSPCVPLRRGSFLSLPHVLYRKEGSCIPFCSIAKAQLSVIDSCSVQERVVPGNFIPFCSIAQAQLSAIESCSVQERGAALSTSVLLRRLSFLSVTHVLYRKGWCLEASSPSVLLRRRSFCH